jgi:hypothetical protein
MIHEGAVHKLLVNGSRNLLPDGWLLRRWFLDPIDGQQMDLGGQCDIDFDGADFSTDSSSILISGRLMSRTGSNRVTLQIPVEDVSAQTFRIEVSAIKSPHPVAVVNLSLRKPPAPHNDSPHQEEVKSWVHRVAGRRHTGYFNAPGYSILRIELHIAAVGDLIHVLRLDRGGSHSPDVEDLPDWALYVPRAVYGPRLIATILCLQFLMSTILALAALFSIYENKDKVGDLAGNIREDPYFNAALAWITPALLWGQAVCDFVVERFQPHIRSLLQVPGIQSFVMLLGDGQDLFFEVWHPLLLLFTMVFAPLYKMVRPVWEWSIFSTGGSVWAKVCNVRDKVWDGNDEQGLQRARQRMLFRHSSMSIEESKRK